MVVGIQFAALPVFAAIMLSGSISEELRRRTLGVLVTTPITGFQIVFGKLAGSLLQLVLLLGCALPVLALLRAFGGVPWGPVGPGLLVTFTTTVLAGSIALWFSIGSRRAPWVFLKTLVTMMIAFLVFPLVWQGAWPGPRSWCLDWMNPYTVMLGLVFQSPGKGGPAAGMWAWHVLASLAASGALLAASVPRVRRAAARQLAGDRPVVRAWQGPIRGRPEPTDCRIRHDPVLWYELRSYRTHLQGLLRPAAWGVGLLLLCQMAAWRAMAEASVQTGFLVGLSGLGLLVTAALAVFSITGERESGTWTLLLATPLNELSIVEAKVTGALVRSLPAWLPLVFHVAVFTLAGYIHPMMLLGLPVILAGGAGLLLGTGVWCAVRFRRTSTAMMVNLGIVLVPWGLLSFICCCGGWFSPLMQVATLAVSLTGSHAASAPKDIQEVFEWCVWTVLIILTALGYRWLSRRFRARAAARLRKTLAW
jgi:ABC-type transport system involved in multi-copper enzyme maturation permease subunit